MKLQTCTRVQAPALNTIVVRESRIDDSTALKSAIVEGVVDDRPVSPEQPNLFRKQQKNLKPLISCKKDAYIGTLNVRTIRE